MIKAGIIGATGYAGAELVRLLTYHPQTEIHAISSVSFEGDKFCEIYPAFRKICENRLVSADKVIDTCEVIFAALPHGLSQQIAVKCYEKGVLFIDIGADFRLDSADEYKKWYGKEYIAPELHKKAVYGLPEIFRKDIKNATIIANPGCYPTSAVLGLYPVLHEGLIETSGIIIDSKSGATGAGRKLTQTTHFTDLNETFSPYNIGKHRHTPEIEQTLTKIAKEPIAVTFTPHLLPINRGIVSTIYVKTKTTYTEVRTAYEKAYSNEKFVRFLPEGITACLGNVRNSNYCDISIHLDEHTQTLIIVSAIDNMVKGAAGQAIQNMNTALGIDETLGLDIIPLNF